MVVQILKFRKSWLAAMVAALAIAGIAGGCSDDGLDFQEPARILYFEAEAFENQRLYSESITRLDKIIDLYPRSRLASFSYLKLGDIYSAQEEWDDALTNYKLYLAANPNSHLTSYVLYRLLVVNNETTLTGLFYKEREIDRGTAPNRNIILEYKRFFLLFPNSTFFPDVQPIYTDARATLARYELMVGDYYFDRDQYNAAASRYWYLLRNYPEYPEAKLVLEKLIAAYRLNQQPDQANEMQVVYEALFGQS